jgi:hypothetical protein
MLRRVFLAVLVPAAVVSCGGGGGDDSPAVPPSTPAALTTVNAPTFATAVDLAARMAATLRIGPTLSTTFTPGTLQDSGCFALGSSPATIVVSPSTGSVSGTVAYSSFDQCFGLKLGGTASITGILNVTQVDRLNFTFSNLSFTASGQTYQMGGSASLQWNLGVGGSANYVMTLNATVSGTRSFRLDNFRVDADLAAGVQHVFISGRLATSEGFVDISPTATRVDLFIPSAGLSNGSVQLTGATTIATVFFNGGGVPPSVISVVPR